ncbi:enoyl-CoA hydratase/isomerase family protein [Pseudomonas ovata]|uniref:enoyl-CoA hydratase/isomerase family protein n=1 Tax=Pseudomonas ovata TaxID=1839709 RepID=UPI000D69063C|nr:enoyl-CoA hydratase/isomerase family protein [Pseudomonas ovata]
MSSPASPSRTAAQASEKSVLIDVRNHIGHLVLNRPAGLNALDLQMVRTLKLQLQAWAEDDDVYAVVLRGAGDKAFCAGGDIRALYDSYTGGHDLHLRFFEEEYALDLAIHDYRKPIMALMDRLVLGGGLGLVHSADLRVVTERSSLGMPEVAIGYFPDVGASYFLPRLPGELGLYLGITGARIGAADALYCGLADWHMPSQSLGRLDHMLDHLKWKSTPLKDLQAVMARLGSQRLPDPPLQRLRPAIDHFFALPDIASIIEQLQQVSVADSRQWALDTARIMQGRSPLAMAVTLELLRRGRQLSLQECFALELSLDRQWFEHGDLIEGVRALIIDKDKQPRWQPATVQALKDEDVRRFFTESEN